MKTKNVKVKFKDIKQGVTLYISHPVYGIERLTVVGKPYYHKTVRSFFVTVVQHYDMGNYKTERSLNDMGVTSTYNDRRTFFKLKHAEEWAKTWSTDKGFQQRHAAHEEWCSMLDEDHYDY